jgi:hypothetical protein
MVWPGTPIPLTYDSKFKGLQIHATTAGFILERWDLPLFAIKFSSLGLGFPSNGITSMSLQAQSEILFFDY